MGQAQSAIECCGPCSVDKNAVGASAHACVRLCARVVCMPTSSARPARVTRGQARTCWGRHPAHPPLRAPLALQGRDRVCRLLHYPALAPLHGLTEELAPAR